MWSKAIIDLNYRLAALCPLKEDIVALIGTADIEIESVAVSDKGFVFWHNVLKQAEKEGKIDDILRAAKRRFPNDDQLQQIAAQLLEANDQKINRTFQRNLCIELINQDEFSAAVPFIIELIGREDIPETLELDLIRAFAGLNRARKTIRNSSKRRAKKLTAFIDTAKGDILHHLQRLQ